jgi:hypothetical protein
MQNSQKELKCMRSNIQVLSNSYLRRVCCAINHEKKYNEYQKTAIVMLNSATMSTRLAKM